MPASTSSGRPAAGGIIFQPPWWQFYDDLPPLDEGRAVLGHGLQGRPDNDYVVGLVAGRIGARIYLIDRVKGQWSFSESCPAD